MPVQHRIEENADGSKTVWVGELEVRHRMRWAVGYTLHPGKSYLEISVRIVNRTPVEQTMLCFANAAVHTNEHYQVIFPPSTQFGTHHHKRQFTHWPIATGRYGGGDFSAGVDISWYKNHISANSVFAWNYEEDFLAGYDHGKQAGTMSIANHHLVPGKKFWTWGNGPRGRMWDKILTDEDGPYIELMVGSYSDNQPDYSWLGPYETRAFKNYWYPFRDIAGVKNANLRAAVNLEIEKSVAKFGFCTTERHERARVLFTLADDVLLDDTVAIDPAHPYTRQIALPDGVREMDIRVSLSAQGKTLVAYTPVRREEQPMPPEFTSPAEPNQIKTVEELYLTGLRIEQFHSPSLDPEPYWYEALRRDPGDTRVNTALGIKAFRKARYEQSKAYLAKALDRLTHGHTTPKEAEARYYLGAVLKAEGETGAAYDVLYQATWSAAWRGPAYYGLAEINSLRREFARGLEHVERAIEVDALNLRAQNLKAAILRHLNRKNEALAVLKVAAHRADPLDARSLAEQWLITRDVKTAQRLGETLNSHSATEPWSAPPST